MKRNAGFRDGFGGDGDGGVVGSGGHFVMIIDHDVPQDTVDGNVKIVVRPASRRRRFHFPLFQRRSVSFHEANAGKWLPACFSGGIAPKVHRIHPTHLKITLIHWLSVFCVAVNPALAQERFRFERPLMGTRFAVVCFVDDGEVAGRAASAAFELARKLDAAASDYLPDSELSMLGSKPIDTPIPLSDLLYGLLEHSRHLAEVTKGAFDPTLGPLTKLWRASREQGRLPDAEDLRSARAAVGWRHFTLDPQSHSITLHRKNMAFDLGGIAKGYAADLMLESLTAAGISRAMVAAGGDIRLGDPPPERAGWKVALQTFDLARPDEILVLANAAVSTSGDLHQSFEIDGVSYSHSLNPGTGLGLTRRIAATVVADEAKLSDPLATAACVLGQNGCKPLRSLPGVREVKPRLP